MSQATYSSEMTRAPRRFAGRLADLGLHADHLAALRRQGFVCEERRGGSRSVFKLRFRHAGRQLVRYLGSDPIAADSLREELKSLQRQRQARQNLKRARADLLAALRRARETLAPLLEPLGFYFHGLIPRQKRTTLPRGV